MCSTVDVEDNIRVFVLPGPGFGADGWRRRYKDGLIPGLNEPLPYGYYRAGRDGFLIDYSQDANEGGLTAFLHRALCRLVVFDISGLSMRFSDITGVTQWMRSMGGDAVLDALLFRDI